MSMQDPIADMLTRVRNAQAVGKTTVSMPSAKTKVAITKVLVDEGYVNGYEVDGDAKKPTLTIELKYHNGTPVIENVRRVSRPGLRIYKQCQDLPQVDGFGVAVVSTSKGVMSDRAARAANLGGEILCELW